MQQYSWPTVQYIPHSLGHGSVLFCCIKKGGKCCLFILKSFLYFAHQLKNTFRNVPVHLNIEELFSFYDLYGFKGGETILSVSLLTAHSCVVVVGGGFVRFIKG